MVHARSTHQDSAENLLALTGGPPMVQIALDLDDDRTRIRCAGIDGATVPAPLLRLVRALTGETA